MNQILLDIETGPDLNDEILAEIKAGLTHDARIKDPVKIAKNLGAKFEKAVDKAACNARTGKIRVINACRMWDENPTIATFADDEEEGKVVGGFADWLAVNHRPRTIFVGYNIGHFDIPFINIRALLHNVRFRSPFPCHNRKWAEFFDIQSVLGEWTDLDGWFKMMGIPPKIASNKEIHKAPLKEVVDYSRAEMASMLKLARRMGTLLNIPELLKL